MNQPLCINCGRRITGKRKGTKIVMDPLSISMMGMTIQLPALHMGVCKTCDDASERMAELLEKGIEFEYSDGTKETLRYKP